MAHLGMSGQLLMQDTGVPDEKHLKVRLRLSPADGMPEQLRFVDQRIFGGLFVTSLIPTADGGPGGLAETPLPLIAEEAAHIARDPLDPHFSFDVVLPPAPEPEDRPQAGPAGPGPGLRDRQHLRGRGPVAGAAPLRPAHRHPAPGRRAAGSRRRPRGDAGRPCRRRYQLRLPLRQRQRRLRATSTGPSTPTAGKARSASAAPLPES